jgi:hypothetical protein
VSHLSPEFCFCVALICIPPGFLNKRKVQQTLLWCVLGTVVCCFEFRARQGFINTKKVEAMKEIIIQLIGRAADLTINQPVLTLFLGAAFLVTFWTILFAPKKPAQEEKSSLLWTIYRHGLRLMWALSIVCVLFGTVALVRVYLHRVVAQFQRTHGRVTEANYQAIQTIWGTSQEQRELQFDLFWEQEVTERIESEDVTRAAVLRKRTVRHDITENPFLSARHEVVLRQNPRKKGSALYGGYDTDCRFTYELRNPADRELNSVLRFPLPSETAVYDGLVATLNGVDVLPQMQIRDGALLLAREVQANETLDLMIAFRSRGMSYWYFQVMEPREIRDFTFTLKLPNLPKANLNFPEGCMTPTDIQESTDGRGTILTFRLDHAITSKGMGISMPTVSQPGEKTQAVLSECEPAWLLVFAMLVLGLTLAEARHALLLSAVFGVTLACAYGLLAASSDLLGFWGTAIFILVPTLAFLAWLLHRFAPAPASRLLVLQFIAFALIYPCLAGLDDERQALYLNISCLLFLGCTAWLLISKLTIRPPFIREQGQRNVPLAA